jgi:hypothetical protein
MLSASVQMWRAWLGNLSVWGVLSRGCTNVVMSDNSQTCHVAPSSDSLPRYPPLLYGNLPGSRPDSLVHAGMLTAAVRVLVPAVVHTHT